MLLARVGMKNAPGVLVVVLAVAFAACGGKGSSPDGGPQGAAGSGGRGGTGGTVGSGGAGGGGSGGAAGVSGAAGTGGGAGGTSGMAGGTGGGAGRGGVTGTAGTSGGTTGTAGTSGSAGRGGTTGTAGMSGSAGRGGTTGTAGTGGTPPSRCATPADCTGPVTGTTFCSPSWTCVDGDCIAECMGGRTCTEAPSSGCLLCRTSSMTTTMSQGCAGTACVFTAARVIAVERNNGCQPSNTPNFDTWHCTGQWAVLDGGNRAVCTIQVVPTDAIRYSVSCGSCVTVVTLGSGP